MRSRSRLERGWQRLFAVGGSLLNTAWQRALILVLLGLAGIVVGPRPARGMGCHVPEKATVPLRFDVTSLAIDLNADPAEVSGLPCSQEIPGTAPVPIGAVLVAVAELGAIRYPEPSGTLVALERSVRTGYFVKVQERPPR
jgi:hypothetical protein